MSQNRIDPLSIVPTTPRQTPKQEFGEVLARATERSLKAGVGILSAAVRGNLVAGLGGMVAEGALAMRESMVPSTPSLISPGLAAVTAAARPPGGQGGVHAATPVNSVPGGSQPAPGASPGQGAAIELAQLQQQMQSESFAYQTQYLQLQNQMQRESREFNTLSNVMKVRHDSAKAAINNIR